ncbi:MAG TPA: hypothetical protein VJ617_16800 [Arthrobacter sp.]|nr:hypothetical protein [Arthrobacter sp.]
MEPYPTHQAASSVQPPHRSHRPALPDWAWAFRTVLIILGAGMAILLLSFLGVNATTEPGLYTESGRAAINFALGLGLLILLLSVPYLLASWL